MKVTLYAGLVCECGCVMLRAERPYNHLEYCVNSKCEHYGVFVQPPTFEVAPGKAHKQ